MSCTCLIDSYDGESAQLGEVRKPRARKEHKCDECGRTIKPGETYELFKYLFEGEWGRTKTCCDCLSARDALFCGGAPAGTIWDEVCYSLEESLSPPSAECMLKLTKPARDKVCDMLERIWGVTK